MLSLPPVPRGPQIGWVGKAERDQEFVPAARVIAYYLPQYHPIPENDHWWGAGFTEWTNAAKAKPLFWGHYQPHLPADLGFYDLRIPEVRAAQAEMAREYGIEAFCYYHYWFGNGRRLLERPFNEVLRSGTPDFPFCLCWANETWTGSRHGSPDKVLIEQTYPDKEDYEKHFEELLPAFRDRRYARIDDKPLFLVYKPRNLPSPIEFTDLWRKLARGSGLSGIFFIGVENGPWPAESNGFDGVTTQGVDLVAINQRKFWTRAFKHRYRRLLAACRRELFDHRLRHIVHLAHEQKISNRRLRSNSQFHRHVARMSAA